MATFEVLVGGLLVSSCLRINTDVIFGVALLSRRGGLFNVHTVGSSAASVAILRLVVPAARAAPRASAGAAASDEVVLPSVWPPPVLTRPPGYNLWRVDLPSLSSHGWLLIVSKLSMSRMSCCFRIGMNTNFFLLI